MPPTVSKCRCDSTVKEECISFHRKCDVTKCPRFISGKELNRFVKKENCFSDTEVYRVCDWMSKHIQATMVGRTPKKKRIVECICRKTPE